MPGDHAGVLERTSPDRAIDAVLQQIADPVRTTQPQLDPRVARLEVVQPWSDHPSGDGDQGVHSEPADGRRRPAPERGLQFVYLLQQDLAFVEVRAAIVRKAQGTGRTIEQAHA